MKQQGLYISPTEYVRFAEGKARSLSDHIATRDRSPDFTALGMYLPNPDPILKKQGKDSAVYGDLRSDAHVGGCIRRRKAGVLTMEWRVVREQASARSAKLAEAVLKALDMRRLMREALDAPLFGWQPLEVIWSAGGGGPILPQDVMAKPANWFHYDAEAQLRFRSREAPLLGEALAPRKFLVPSQDASYANPYGFADLSMCFWPTVFKRGGLKFWVTFSEKYGTPWLVGKTPRNTPKGEQDALLDQLEAMVQDAVAVIPDDASVDIVESAGKSASADLYERLLMFCRSEVAIALLGQNQTTEASANRASAMAGLQVTDELRDADARLVEATVNQLLRWVVDLNEGEAAPAPKFELYEQEEVDKQQAERDQILVKAGAKLTRAYFMRTYELEEDDIAEDVPASGGDALGAGAVVPAAQPAPAANQFQAALKKALAAMQTGGTAAFADVLPAAQADAMDVLVDAELAQWQPLLDPMVAPLQAAIDRSLEMGQSAEELLASLPELLQQMQVDALAQALTRTAFTARLGGEAGLLLATDEPAAQAAFAEPAATAAAAPALPSIELHVHPVIQMPEQPPASVQITNEVAPTPLTVEVRMPEQPAAQVLVTNQVHPAAVTVIDNHPTRAEQVVERDSADEITKTITMYHRD